MCIRDSGITLGTGIGGMRTIIEQEAILHEGGLRRLNPFGITMIMPNGCLLYTSRCV